MIKYILLWNIVVFVVYGLDKLFAKIKCRRIPEKVLILLAFMGGSVGAFLGMQVFRHKIRKNKFKILVPLALVINVFLLIVIINKGKMLPL